MRHDLYAEKKSTKTLVNGEKKDTWREIKKSKKNERERPRK